MKRPSPIDYAAPQLSSVRRRPRLRWRLVLLACLCFSAAGASFFFARSRPHFFFTLGQNKLSDEEAAAEAQKDSWALGACLSIPIFSLTGIVLLVYAIPQPPE
jgi:hypothetical protein